MNFHFSIEYKTQWGEELRMSFGDREYALKTYDGNRWEADIRLKASEAGPQLTYLYALYRDGQLVWTEWEAAPHTLRLDGKNSNPTVADDDREFVINDFWRPIPEDLPLFSSAFSDCIAPHNPSAAPMQYYNRTLQLRVVEPRLLKHQQLGICGNIPQLGNWRKAVPLALVSLQEWAVNINAGEIFHPLEYKYVIIDRHGNVEQWEEGTNRQINSLQIASGGTWVKNDSRPRFALPKWKCAGIVIPVFSLRTAKSFGIGDFGDLKDMIHWAASAGMHAVQILPVNDTMKSGSWQDSYPYNAISIYAFHPIYCNLNALPRLSDKLKMETFLIRQQELNALPQLDYEQVIRLKMEYLRLAYEQEGKSILASKDYRAWFESNSEWLVPYAAFSFLRDTYGTPDFNQWPAHSTYVADDIKRLCAPRSRHHRQIALYYYIQYQLHLQLTEVRDTARTAGIIIKGDIPIGISRTSVEAWTEPQYFNLGSQAGAPPDDFSVNGQNWGFPTYNWPAMQTDGCTWWIRRLRKMAEYFDAYRIDHVLGFFRIWDIPLDSVHGLLGQFAPALPMSRSEIESYGLPFDPVLMTEPYINDDILYQMFGPRAELVKTIYLDTDTEKTKRAAIYNSFGTLSTFYKMKAEYNTQRKIQATFSRKTDPESCDLRDGLYALISNVLFVIDRHNTHLYHPRISAQLDYAYRFLTAQQQRAFNHLYNDYYFKRHNQFWYDEAMKKLPRLTQSTRMLVCAEDLGMIPECVPWVMEQLRILSLEIQTMPKAYGCEFGDLSKNPYRSVATITTHDMPTLRLWWEEDAARAQRYFNQALHIDGQAPRVLPPWLCEEIINRHLYSPSMLCLISFQDWLSLNERLRNPDVAQERINVPASPHHYWRWRMHISIEQLNENHEFTEHLQTMIQRSGR